MLLNVFRFAPIICKNSIVCLPWKASLHTDNATRHLTSFFLRHRCYFHTSTSHRVVKSPFPDKVIPELSLHEYFFKNRGVEDPLYICGVTGRSYSHKNMTDLVWRTAKGLTHQGVRKNTVVMIVSENCIEYVIAFHALLLLGAIATMANPAYLTADVILQAKDSNTEIIISSEKCITTCVEVQKALSSHIQKLIVFGSHSGCLPFSELTSYHSEAYPIEVDIDPKRQIAVLPYSSGTTGLPKGVMLSHYSQVSNCLQIDTDCYTAKIRSSRLLESGRETQDN